MLPHNLTLIALKQEFNTSEHIFLSSLLMMQFSCRLYVSINLSSKFSLLQYNDGRGEAAPGHDFHNFSILSIQLRRHQILLGVENETGVTVEIDIKCSKINCDLTKEL